MNSPEQPLERDALNPDPIQQFHAWFQQAQTCGLKIPEAMCLSTLDAQQRPDSRMVLLKGYDVSGFVFYTNLRSAKGEQLRKNPDASLVFYWEPLERQVRIAGKALLVAEAEADAYFKTRPRLAQIGAWASDQSQPLADRQTLEQRMKTITAKFKDQDISRPPHWGGYRVAPERIEFWQGRANRLHDRFLYTRQAGNVWDIVRLFP